MHLFNHIPQWSNFSESALNMAWLQATSNFVLDDWHIHQSHLCLIILSLAPVTLSQLPQADPASRLDIHIIFQTIREIKESITVWEK